MSSIDQEIWFQKIIREYSSEDLPIIFCCNKTNVEIPFVIDVMKIRDYYETMYFRWIDGEKYYRISQRNIGLSKPLWLFVDETGEKFIIQL